MFMLLTLKHIFHYMLSFLSGKSKNSINNRLDKVILIFQY